VREEDIVDPRVVPRWVEAGVSGLPRSREWDAVTVVELPELESSSASELTFRVLGDASVAGAEGLPGAAVERIVAELESAVRPPYEVRAARRGRCDWSVAARELRLESVPLLGSLPGDELAVAVTPDGERTTFVDGEETGLLTADLEAAFAVLERRGRERFPAFVSRAERVGPGRWELSVDPL
jgi:hypothetical protein